MTITKSQFPTLAKLREASFQQCREALAQGQRVYLVVPDMQRADACKLQLPAGLSMGVNVQQWGAWLSGMWELFGPGSQVVSGAVRSMLARPIMEKALGMEPSCGYVENLSGFLRDCITLSWESASLEDSELRVVDMLASYKDALQKRGLVEELQALEQLACFPLEGFTFVFEGLDISKSPRESALDALGAVAQVYVNDQSLIADEPDDPQADELANLIQCLYSGKTGLAPTGAVCFMEVNGCHSQDQAVAGLIAQAVDHASNPGAVAACISGGAESVERLLSQLESSDIAFEATFSTPLSSTAFGAALVSLINIRTAIFGKVSEEDLYRIEQSLSQFACSPFSGLSASTGQGLVTRWRSCAIDVAQRLEELGHGFKGSVNNKTWKELLVRIQPLLDEGARLEDLARVMFENGKALHCSVNQLLDARAVADTVIDYGRLCDALGVSASRIDLPSLNVNLSRSFGDGPAVKVTDSSQLEPGMWEQVVFGSLDSGSYSMAQGRSPFEGVASKLGCPQPVDKADTQRILLKNILEAAGRGASFYRVAYDQMGNEQCASALWDELLSVYLPGIDEEESNGDALKVLEGKGCYQVVSEGECFRGAAVPEESFQVARGLLQLPDTIELLPLNTETYNETYSPTALEDYYRCPYRWFVCRRIGANSLDLKFDQIHVGNLAHAALNRFYRQWQELGHQRVTPETLDEALVVADESFSWQLEHEIEKGRLAVSTQQDMQECEYLRGQVLDLIRRDAWFLPGFVPTYLELDLRSNEGNLQYAGVPVRGKVDRIDVNAQGQAVIIDYKLSSLETGYGFKADEELPLRIQTDIYAKLVQRYFQEQGQHIEVIGSVYRSYAKNKLRGVYARGIDWGPEEQVKASHDELPCEERNLSYGAYLDKVEEVVAQKMECLREGLIAPAPIEDGACTYCLAADFCKEVR